MTERETAATTRAFATLRMTMLGCSSEWTTSLTWALSRGKTMVLHVTPGTGGYRVVQCQ